MDNNIKTKGRILVGVVSSVKDEDPRTKNLHYRKIRVRIPQFDGPVYPQELPEGLDKKVYWTPEENLSWLPVCLPLGSFNADVSSLFKINEMVYVTYTDDSYRSPLIIGTTGSLIDNSLLSTPRGFRVSTGTDGQPPLYGRESSGEDFKLKEGESFVLPVESYIITSRYELRGEYFHYGVDFAADLGTKISAIFDGVVVNTTGNVFEDNSGNTEKVSTSSYDSYGNCITLQHISGDTVFYTRYAHLFHVSVSEGQEVKKGNVIGLMGSTGNSTGPHLHFEILNGGTVASRNSVNPADYLDI